MVFCFCLVSIFSARSNSHVFIEFIGGPILREVINLYRQGGMMHPKTLQLKEGVLHIKDTNEPKKEGEVKARLEDIEQEIYKCLGTFGPAEGVHKAFGGDANPQQQNRKSSGPAL